MLFVGRAIFLMGEMGKEYGALALRKKTAIGSSCQGRFAE